MKRPVTCALILILTAGAPLRAQEHPFQDTKLSEEERLDNAVSLMTVDEKIATLVGQGVPRLGIAGPGSTEAIHGIVRGGATDLPALRGGSNNNRPAPKYRNSTAFPQAYGIGETWVRDILDLPNMLDYDIRHGRTYMYARAKPLFPFGFGLSYTTFKYSRLKVKKDGDNYVVRFDLKNTGSRDGEEVVQLYAKFKGDDASKRLRGFERIPVKAGETVPVEIVVPADDLKLWDSQTHAWAFRGRKAKLLVGASSEDIRLKKSIKL